MVLLAVFAVVAALLPRGTALAHNVAAGGAYNCAGGWSVQRQLPEWWRRRLRRQPSCRHRRERRRHGHQAVPLFRHADLAPAPPAGFTVVDHPTMTTFQLFSLSGTTSPISVTGSIKLYSSGSPSQPSSDPAYKRYQPQFSANPIPQPAQATGCATSTPTHQRSTPLSPTATSTATSTANSDADSYIDADTYDHDRAVVHGSCPHRGSGSVPAGIGAVPLTDVPLSALAQENSPAASKLSSIKLSSILLSSIKLSSIKLSSIKLSSIQLSSIKLSSIPITRRRRLGGDPGGHDPAGRAAAGSSS